MMPSLMGHVTSCRTRPSVQQAGCTLDDIVWHQALVTLRRLDSELRPKRKELPVDQWVLYELLHHGVVDPQPRDRAFDASTRAMRYSAAVTDRVWSLLDKETTRVSLCTLLRTTSELTTLDREIVLSPRCSNRGRGFRT